MKKMILVLLVLIMTVASQAFAQEKMLAEFTEIREEKVKEHRAKAFAEMKIFREKISGMPDPQREEAAITFREQQHAEDLAFLAGEHEVSMKALRKELAADKKLKAEEKEKTINDREKRYEEYRSFVQKSYRDFVATRKQFMETKRVEAKAAPQKTADPKTAN